MNTISDWKESSFLFTRNGNKITDNGEDDALAGVPGVYMLYDAESNEFYVGKAKNLRKRIIEHAENADGNDPIPNFTHYRYSPINGKYMEFLYLIENAAIHDCAMLIRMHGAETLNMPLVDIAASNGNTLDKCKIVNTAQFQRKIETR